MDLQHFRAAHSITEDRVGGTQYFVVGTPIRGGNGAMVERIETHGAGVLITMATSRVRYGVFIGADGSSGRTADEAVEAKGKK